MMLYITVICFLKFDLIDDAKLDLHHPSINRVDEANVGLFQVNSPIESIAKALDS